MHNFVLNYNQNTGFWVRDCTRSSLKTELTHFLYLCLAHLTNDKYIPSRYLIAHLSTLPVGKHQYHSHFKILQSFIGVLEAEVRNGTISPLKTLRPVFRWGSGVSACILFSSRATLCWGFVVDLKSGPVSYCSLKSKALLCVLRTSGGEPHVSVPRCSWIVTGEDTSETGHKMMEEALQQQEWVPRPKGFYEAAESYIPCMEQAQGERLEREGDCKRWHKAISFMSTSSTAICAQMALETYVSIPDPSITDLSTRRPQRFPKPIMFHTDLRIFPPKSGHLPLLYLSRWCCPSIWFGKVWFGKLICSARSPLAASSPNLYLCLLPEMDAISSSLDPHIHSRPPAPSQSNWSEHFKMQIWSRHMLPKLPSSPA